MDTYKIIRHFAKSSKRLTIKKGLSLSEAQKHCRDPETSSRTCTSSTKLEYTRRKGPWFDGYTLERKSKEAK